MPDPSKERRDDFLAAIRERFRDVREAIVRWVGEEDILGLRTKTNTPATAAESPDDAPDIFRFQTDSAKVGAFIAWLGDRVQRDVLKPADREAIRNGEHWTADLLRPTYVQAWQQGRSRLRTAGVSIGPVEDAEDIFQLPVAERDLRRIYTRTYENLQSVTADTAEPVRETLTEGLEKGWNPRKTARELDETVESLQRTRAETLARTETVSAYTEGTISRYKRAGVDTVQHGEWIDSDDSRVCPVCSSLDGREIPLATIDSATFTFSPDDDEPDSLAGTYSLKPPTHPGCRCVLAAVVD